MSFIQITPARSVGIVSLALTFFAVFASSSAHARLGETIAECEARYGEVRERIKPLSAVSDEYAIVFIKAGIRIVVEYKDGKAWKLNYQGDENMAMNFNNLLGSNNGDERWGEPFEAAGKKYWIRPDGKAHAVGSFDRTSGLLIVLDDAFLKARSTAYKARLADAANERAKYLNQANPLPGF